MAPTGPPRHTRIRARSRRSGERSAVGAPAPACAPEVGQLLADLGAQRPCGLRARRDGRRRAGGRRSRGRDVVPGRDQPRGGRAPVVPDPHGEAPRRSRTRWSSPDPVRWTRPSRLRTAAMTRSCWCAPPAVQPGTARWSCCSRSRTASSISVNRERTARRRRSWLGLSEVVMVGSPAPGGPRARDPGGRSCRAVRRRGPAGPVRAEERGLVSDGSGSGSTTARRAPRATPTTGRRCRAGW